MQKTCAGVKGETAETQRERERETKKDGAKRPRKRESVCRDKKQELLLLHGGLTG